MKFLKNILFYKTGFIQLVEIIVYRTKGKSFLNNISSLLFLFSWSLASLSFHGKTCQSSRWLGTLWCHSPHWCQKPTLGLAVWKNDQLGSYNYDSLLWEVGNSHLAFFFLLLVPWSGEHTQLPGSSALKTMALTIKGSYSACYFRQKDNDK